MSKLDSLKIPSRTPPMPRRIEGLVCRKSKHLYFLILPRRSGIGGEFLVRRFLPDPTLKPELTTPLKPTQPSSSTMSSFKTYILALSIPTIKGFLTSSCCSNCGVPLVLVLQGRNSNKSPAAAASVTTSAFEKGATPTVAQGGFWSLKLTTSTLSDPC